MSLLTISPNDCVNHFCIACNIFFINHKERSTCNIIFKMLTVPPCKIFSHTSAIRRQVEMGFASSTVGTQALTELIKEISPKYMLDN